METLKHDNMEETYPVPPEMDGVGVIIEENYKDSSVVIKFGDHLLRVDIKGARDMAFALRQAANKLEKHARTEQWIK